MHGFRLRFSNWDDTQAVAVFVIRLLMISAVAALPVIFWLRAMYYNFAAFDDSALSIEIANEMWGISTFIAPLFSVLGKYMLSGLRKAYPHGRGYSACCSALEWGLNVELIVAGARIALTAIAQVVSLLAR